MKYFIWLYLLLFVSSVNAQENDTITEKWIRERYTKREVMVEMRDGVHLFTSIYEPKNKTHKSPIIMNRTCYSVAPYGKDNFIGLHRPAWAEFARNNYIFVFQDVRGKNMSEGSFMEIRPFIKDKSIKKAKAQRKRGECVEVDEASDTYDTAEWLVHNTNNNGNIGILGISYPGFYSTMAALSYHPAIKAVSPQAPVTDWYRGDDVHHNGAFFLMDNFSFQYWFEYENNVKERMVGGMNAQNPSHIVYSDAYNSYLKIGPIKNFSKLYGDSVAGWNSFIKHPNLDSWWEERNVLNHLKEIRPAVMVVGGLFDAEDCYGAFATYKQIKKDSPKTELYFVEGPWAHGTWGRGAKPFFGDIYLGQEQISDYYLKNIEYPFFAYYLEGKGKKPKSKVRVYQPGDNKWFYYETWPVQSERVPFELEMKTYTSNPACPVPWTSDISAKGRRIEDMLCDQRFASSRPDVAVFESSILKDTLRLSGEIEAELYVSITTTDADFVVKVIDVFPDNFNYPDEIMNYKEDETNMSGYQMLVRWEVMRGKYRNSLSFPEPFVPGQKTKVRVPMSDIAHTFLPGHKLMVQVQSSCFPLIDMNPQTFCDIYQCDESAFQSTTVTIFPESKIWLPVLK
ncbi:MAG: CocE/NonD family hydrolase [Bacteroidaceae bacterium]|nr:CocE/NonD family hydrolase [Bacteroidaceae bacterium]